ncbi:MAG: extracellular solute-binding protein [Coprobacillus sp.]|nr:extracellular solute-binding protein [Coprobacillus sp.]
MNKGLKTFALVGLAACAIGAASALTACDNREKFTVWCAEEVSSLTKTQIERYISQFDGTEDEFPYKLVVENVSESNAVTNVLTDVTAAGDIFFFAQDQLARVVQSGALSAVPDRFVDDVTSRNDSDSVSAASVGGTLYVYPVTFDNGYFAYYDSSVLTADDMKDQTTMIEKVKAADKKISFEYTSGWYNAAYFFGTGCVSNWEIDVDGTFTDYVDTFNSIPDGYDALEGLAELANSGICVDSSSGGDFAASSAVVVSGTWDSSTVKGLLGDDYAACELWSVTVPANVRGYYTSGVEDSNANEDGSRTYHLGSFNGSKLLGVRNNVDGEKNAWSHNIANYLTSEECQLERFNSNGWGPSNLKAQEDPAVADDIALTAFQAQNEYSQTQGDYPGSWWDTATKVGTDVSTAGSTTLTADQMATILADYDAGNAAVLTASQYAYALVGNLEGLSWTTAPATYGYTDYALSDKNAEAGTYSVDADGVKHGKWVLNNIVVEGGGCYVNGSSKGDGSSEGDIELGLFRFVDYGDWSGNWGYNELSDKTGYYNWNSEGLGGGTDNNIGAVPGTYNIIFDYTGSTPAITVTAVA